MRRRDRRPHLARVKRRRAVRGRRRPAERAEAPRARARGRANNAPRADTDRARLRRVAATVECTNPPKPPKPPKPPRSVLPVAAASGPHGREPGGVGEVRRDARRVLRRVVAEEIRVILKQKIRRAPRQPAARQNHLGVGRHRIAPERRVDRARQVAAAPRGRRGRGPETGARVGAALVVQDLPQRVKRGERAVARVRAASGSRRARGAGAVRRRSASRREPPARPRPAPAPGAAPFSLASAAGVLSSFGPPLRLPSASRREPRPDARGRGLERGQRALTSPSAFSTISAITAGSASMPSALATAKSALVTRCRVAGLGARRRRRTPPSPPPSRARKLAARTVVTAVARIAGLLGQHDARGRARSRFRRASASNTRRRALRSRAREVLHRARAGERESTRRRSRPPRRRRSTALVPFDSRGAFALAFRRGRGLTTPGASTSRLEEEGFEIVELGSVRHPGRGGVLVLLPQRRRGGRHSRTPLPNSRATRRSAADLRTRAGRRGRTRGAPGWSHARSRARAPRAFLRHDDVRLRPARASEGSGRGY